MNKRMIVMIVGGAIILLAAVGHRLYMSKSSSSAPIATLQGTNNGEPDRKGKTEATVRTPKRGYISTSIDNMARQIIENAPNQEEAFSFLVEAKSYRIQELRARRAKEKAAEEKARYDAELWHTKRGQIDIELAKEAEKDSVDTQAGPTNGYVGNARGVSNQRVSTVKDNKTYKNVSLNEFTLRAIMKDGNGYVARIAYSGRNMPAKTGYKLLGNVMVDSVTANQVVLKKGDDSVALYAY